MAAIENAICKFKDECSPHGKRIRPRASSLQASLGRPVEPYDRCFKLIAGVTSLPAKSQESDWLRLMVARVEAAGLSAIDKTPRVVDSG